VALLLALVAVPAVGPTASAQNGEGGYYDAALPSLGSQHVKQVTIIFGKVSVDGNPTNVLHGVQTYTIPPGGGAMFELTIDQPGLYPFVTHSFAYTSKGPAGVIKVVPAK
jgi:nitrite reductase (NO-forming)